LAPYVRYQYANIKDNISIVNNGIETRIDREGKHQLLGFGLNLGHNFVFNDRISIDVYAGPQFQRKFESGDAKDRSLYFNAKYFGRVGLNVGFKF
jgi:hypothetical protein